MMIGFLTAFGMTPPCSSAAPRHSERSEEPTQTTTEWLFALFALNNR